MKSVFEKFMKRVGYGLMLHKPSKKLRRFYLTLILIIILITTIYESVK